MVLPFCVLKKVCKVNRSVMTTKIFFRNKHTIVSGTISLLGIYVYVGGTYILCPHANYRVVLQHNPPICIACSRPNGIAHRYCRKHPGEICTPEGHQPPGTTVGVGMQEHCTEQRMHRELGILPRTTHMH